MAKWSGGPFDRSPSSATVTAVALYLGVRLGMEENKPLRWPARGVNTSMLKSSLRKGSDGYSRQTIESENLAAPQAHDILLPLLAFNLKTEKNLPLVFCT
jgi:hypothetical protein